MGQFPSTIMLGFELIKVRLGPAAANCSKATSADRFLHFVEDLVPGEGLLGRQIGHGLNFNASASSHEAGVYRKNVAAPKRSSYIAIANASVLQFNY